MRPRDQEIERGKARLARTEKRLEELRALEKTLPKIGYGRTEWKEVKKTISQLEELVVSDRAWITYAEETETLLDAMEKESEAKYGKYEMSEQQKVEFELFLGDLQRRQEEREKMNREAEKRREKFKLIFGDKE